MSVLSNNSKNLLLYALTLIVHLKLKILILSSLGRVQRETYSQKMSPIQKLCFQPQIAKDWNHELRRYVVGPNLLMAITGMAEYNRYSFEVRVNISLFCEQGKSIC
ncbi:hypothetical protein L596_017324 [Steinernema carpocapsae]|uniref:Uncharacterized protein n=1 Tax=Steinernema carpocapsae TaxID=34508 RepID=A0A4U5N203_STECR|nr:hypothetical protein L596_017324 [Steinernema carpocapsae]